MIEITEEELTGILSDTDPSTVAIDDYIDPETGEILWSEGEMARQSAMWFEAHPEDIVKDIYIDSDPWDEPGVYIQDFLSRYDAKITTVGDFVELGKERDFEVNYPLDMQFPTDIKRKDGKPFQKTDMDNLEWLEDALNGFAKLDTNNLKFIISPNGSRTNADVSPAFS